jgi:hypothetical protein
MSALRFRVDGLPSAASIEMRAEPRLLARSELRPQRLREAFLGPEKSPSAVFVFEPSEQVRDLFEPLVLHAKCEIDRRGDEVEEVPGLRRDLPATALTRRGAACRRPSPRDGRAQAPRREDA